MESRFEISLKDKLNDTRLQVAGSITGAASSAYMGGNIAILEMQLQKMHAELLHKGFTDYAEVADCAARLLIALEQHRISYSYQNPSGGWDGGCGQINSLVSQSLLDRTRRALQKLDLPNNKQRYS